MPRLSIVIPALGAWKPLEATLVSVLGNLPDDAEIVVALHEGYDDPYGLAGEVRFVPLRPTATTLDAWNDGVAACHAPIVHLLACGATVGEGWCDAALRHFDDARVAAVAALVIGSDAPRIHTAGWQYSLGGVASNFAVGGLVDSVGEPDDRWMGPHGAAAFYRRSALASVSAAFDPSLGEVASLDLGLRLRAAGYRAILEPNCRVTLAEQFGGEEPSALQAEQIFWRHAASDGSWQPIVAHFGAVMGEFARAFPRPRCASQLAQRLAGWITTRRSTYAAYRLAPYVDILEPEAPLGSSRRRFHRSHGSISRASTRRANVAEQTAASHEAR